LTEQKLGAIAFPGRKNIMNQVKKSLSLFLVSLGITSSLLGSSVQNGTAEDFREFFCEEAPSCVPSRGEGCELRLTGANPKKDILLRDGDQQGQGQMLRLYNGKNKFRIYENMDSFIEKHRSEKENFFCKSLPHDVFVEVLKNFKGKEFSSQWIEMERYKIDKEHESQRYAIDKSSPSKWEKFCRGVGYLVPFLVPFVKELPALCQICFNGMAKIKEVVQEYATQKLTIEKGTFTNFMYNVGSIPRHVTNLGSDLVGGVERVFIKGVGHVKSWLPYLPLCWKK
jgi:hypothetical protein